jgi:hypothetical protein
MENLLKNARAQWLAALVVFAALVVWAYFRLA